MAFDVIPTKTASGVGKITIILVDPDPSNLEENQDVLFNIEIKFNDESIEEKGGGLIPHLTGNQIAQLQTFLTDMRTKAEAEFLP